MLARLADGYELYPEKYKPNGYIAQRALMMMADVGNQAGQGRAEEGSGTSHSRSKRN